jgi:hypothetical protein
MNDVDAAVPPNEAPEMWHVQLPTGELCVMTLDQLDEAFQSGLINESTHVLQAGGTVWAKLGDIAGIEGGDAPEASGATDAGPAPEAAPAPLALESVTERAVELPASLDPIAGSTSGEAAVAMGEPLADALAETFAAMPASTASPATSADEEIGYIPQLPSPGTRPVPAPAPAPVAVAAPATHATPATPPAQEEEIGYIPQLPRLGTSSVPAPSVAPSVALGQAMKTEPAVKAEEELVYVPQLPRIVTYPVAAAVDAVARPAAAAPATTPAPYEPSFSSSMPSVRPFVADVDFDDVPAQFRGSRKRGFVMAAVVVTLLGGIGVAAVNLGGGMSAPSAAAGTSTAVTAPVAAPVAPPPAPMAIPELAATADTHKEVRLNDEQRKAVLDADKARAAKHKARAAAPSRAKHKNGPTPFHAGGSQGDPLNSSL